MAHAMRLDCEPEPWRERPGGSCAAPATPHTPLAEIDWSDRAVTVMGLGRHGGGVAAAHYLAGRGARVTISDLADRQVLGDSLTQLRDVPLAAVNLGGHDPADFDTEFVVVNPAVRTDNSTLQVARDAGARLISETELFLELCPARIVGVTGSNGKSTTCAMLHAILAAAGRCVWLGGNIGHSLLGELHAMTEGDWVVLELSSFQLAHLGPATRLPEVAVVTNCSPHHLDWHGSYRDYAAAKQRILSNTSAGVRVVLNSADVEVVSWARLVRSPAVDCWPPGSLPLLRLPGHHNRQNAACAATAAELCGVDRATIHETLRTFRGLEHRLQPLGEVAGRRFYNDSKATSPRATMAALAALEGPLWLLAGGDAKGADFHQLAAAIVTRCQGAALFGAAGDALRSAVERSGNATGRQCASCRVEHLADALDWCWGQSRAGEAIVLSPACASHDQYFDFQHRGTVFGALVAQIAAREDRQ